MVRRKFPRAKPKKKRRGAPSPGDAKGAMKGVPIPKSGRSGIYWPAMPRHVDATVLALQYQLEQSQWWPAETLVEHQLRQLEPLLAHAARTVPFYRDRLGVLAGTRRGDLTMDLFRRLPLLRRTDIQEAEAALVSRRPPKDHGKVSDISTSGSTGRPITVKGTEITALFLRALNLRYHLWHGRDFSGKTARITGAVPSTDSGKPVAWVPGYHSGPMVSFDATRPTVEQLAWLEQVNSDYLLTYPSNLLSLLQHCEKTGVRFPDLREVATMGEVLEPEVRAACERVWGIPVVDAYSAQEVGIVALQCPEHQHYHVQAESVLVEILDNDGKPCPPGEVGRLVVTDLHNFATPLIRYGLGDYAEAGGPCPCGRGLPVIRRILGRVRNMATLPSGEKFWPRFYSDDLAGIAPVRQVQLVQRSVHDIDVRLVVARALTGDEEERLKSVILEYLGHPFTLRFTYVDEIPRSASGKYEDFLSVIDQ